LLSALGGPTGSFSGTTALETQRRWIDVNGDGLPDIYEPGSIYLNEGGSGRTFFRHISLSMAAGVPDLDYKRAIHAFAMDVDGDGQEELMIPDVRTIGFCGGTGQLLDNGYACWCGSDFDRAPDETWRAYDRSVFRWNAYKFVEKSDGTYEMAL